MNLKIVTLEQGSAKWLHWREDGIGGSDVPVIMGTCDEKTQYRLFLEKTKQIEPEDFSKNPHVRRGKRCEPYVREVLSNHFCVNFEVFCAEDREHPHRRVSFDGVALMQCGKSVKAIPAEIKCPCESVFSEIKRLKECSHAYMQYEPQLLYQMAMLDAPFGYLVFYEEHSREFLIFNVEANLFRQNEILKNVDHFYKNHVLKMVPPLMDKQRDVFRLSNSSRLQWQNDAAELNSIKKREDKLKAELFSLKRRRDEISARLIKMSQGFKSVRLDNIQVTRVMRNNGVDYKKILEDRGITISENEIQQYSKDVKISYRVSLFNRDKIPEVGVNNLSKAICNFDELKKSIANHL